MPDSLHSVLRRQLKRCFGSLDAVPAALQPLVAMVDETYQQADADRRMLERSLDLSSQELLDANAQLRQAITGLRLAHQDMEARVVERTSALEAAQERLRQTTKMEAVGQLAGGVAHDFNNLLTVIGGCTDLLLASADVRDENRGDLNEIRRAALRATALTQQLLAFSRRQVLQPETIDLTQAVLGLQKMLRRVIREDIALVVDASDAAWVCVDPNQFEQVVLNLVLNARDALPEGGAIRLSVSHEQPPADAASQPGGAGDEYVCVRVADNGVGMTPDVRDRVFEPFFTTKERGKGTGLGLASVYGIVRQSNGSIAVDSVPGGGSTFTIFFPASQPEPGARPPERTDEASGGRRETVLLVEDENAVRRVVRAMLERHGYQVMEAGSAFDACDVFEEHADHIQLLVTDVVMPGMNGPALAQRLVAAKPELPVLFISGYTDLDPNALGLGHRNVGFLSKPITAERLAAKIREIFALS